MDDVQTAFKKAQNYLQNDQFQESYKILLSIVKNFTNILEEKVQWENGIIINSLENKDKLFKTFNICLNVMNHIITIMSFQNSISLSSQTDSKQLEQLKIKKYIPLIPISPLIVEMIKSTNNFQVAKKKLNAGKSTDSLSTRDFRNLIETVSMYQSKINNIKQDIKKIVYNIIYEFDPDKMAKQLTIINVKLFKKINVKEDFVNYALSKESKPIQALLDFNYYLKHLLIYSILKPNKLSENTEIERNYVIQFILTVAHYLYQKYRNFNSLLTIGRVLLSPEIRRLTKTWDLLDNKSKNNFNYFNQTFPKNYSKEVNRLLEAFQFNTGKIMVIPDINTEVEQINTIFQQYDTGKGLNDLGESHLEEHIQRIECCRGYGFIISKSNVPSSNSTLRPVGFLPDYPKNLSDLGVGDLLIEHWILSRVYLSDQDLWKQSVECE
ncbi:ras guanine nucleotide exchange factor domain-containing protein, partial [Neocallimastix sp. 'constans']